MALFSDIVTATIARDDPLTLSKRGKGKKEQLLLRLPEYHLSAMFLDNHKQLDAVVEKFFALHRKQDIAPDWPVLLNVITIFDSKLVNHSQDEAEVLLSRHPSIRTVLEDAWKNGSYKGVRRLGVFCALYALCF
jgi:hypothetical protein